MSAPAVAIPAPWARRRTMTVGIRPTQIPDVKSADPTLASPRATEALLIAYRGLPSSSRHEQERTSSCIG